jgi:outer membrane protein
MANKISIFLVLLLLLFSEKVSAQKLWTLEECISHAMRNNLQIQQAENNLKISDQNLLQNKAATLPTLNGTGTYNYNVGRTIDPFTNQYTNSKILSNNFSLNSTLVLFNGSQIRNTIQQSRYDFLATNYQLETLKNDISLNIAAAYLDILFNKELVSNSANQLSLTKEQYQRTQKLVDAGSLSQTALFDIKSEMALEEAQLVRDQNNLKLSYLNLSQYLDLPSTEPFDIVNPGSLLIDAESNSIHNPDDIVKTAMESQPQIKNYEYRRLSSIEALHIARGRLSPRLTFNATLSTLYSSSSKRITGQQTNITNIGYTQSLQPVYAPLTQYTYENKPYNNQLSDNLNRFVGFTLAVPILNGLQVRTAITRAKISMDNANLDLKITKLTLEKTIRKAYTDAEVALSNYNASANSVKASEEALRNSERRLDVGLINTFEYNQTKTRLIASQSDLLRTKYDYIFKVKILDFYRGIPLKL